MDKFEIQVAEEGNVQIRTLQIFYKDFGQKKLRPHLYDYQQNVK